MVASFPVSVQALLCVLVNAVPSYCSEPVLFDNMSALLPILLKLDYIYLGSWVYNVLITIQNVTAASVEKFGTLVLNKTRLKHVYIPANKVFFY